MRGDCLLVLLYIMPHKIVCCLFFEYCQAWKVPWNTGIITLEKKKKRPVGTLRTVQKLLGKGRPCPERVGRRMLKFGLASGNNHPNE